MRNVARLDFHYPQLDEVEQLAQHITEFDVTHHRMEIYGICKECKDKKNNRMEEIWSGTEIIFSQNLFRCPTRQG